ncbi:hypothetical protein CGL51_01090 [Pyrobaculum aerophilum]|uniref:Uncharacterized protein n=1 Tax=Pyrobaculum aerophilum TaxID=13773 RepID=A0A371R3G5_9CREN|nr:hypothetical protein CGL51_01090 [Pyrobaculum aerophilum]
MVLAIIATILVIAAVVELYDEQVQEDCVGPGCVIAYSYQKTWTKIWYDDSSHSVVGHAGDHDIKSGGIRYYIIKSHLHPAHIGCIGDPWSGYQWARIDYDNVDWYDAGIGYLTTWFTQSSVWVDAC